MIPAMTEHHLKTHTNCDPAHVECKRIAPQITQAEYDAIEEAKKKQLQKGKLLPQKKKINKKLKRNRQKNLQKIRL